MEGCKYFLAKPRPLPPSPFTSPISFGQVCFLWVSTWLQPKPREPARTETVTRTPPLHFTSSPKRGERGGHGNTRAPIHALDHTARCAGSLPGPPRATLEPVARASSPEPHPSLLHGHLPRRSSGRAGLSDFCCTSIYGFRMFFCSPPLPPPTIRQ